MAKVRYQMVDAMAKVMEVKIPTLGAGQEAKALVTFEIRRRVLLPPENTDQYVLPDLKKLDRKLRMFLASSPMIESRDRKIRKLAKVIGVEKPAAWEHVEAIYDWVRENVEYKNGPIKGALAALRDFRDGTNLTGLNPQEEKLIRHIGVSGHNSSPALMEFMQRDKDNLLETMLVAINANDRLHLNHQFNSIPVAAAKGMGVIAMKVTAQDGLFGQAPGKSSIEPLLRYSLSLPVAVAVVGMPKLEYVRQNTQLARDFTPMPAEEMRRFSTEMADANKVAMDRHFCCHEDA